MESQSVTVSLDELVKALELRTKIRRAPNGERSTGLRSIAFLPTDSGIILEMPGSAQTLLALDGKLLQGAAFPTKDLDPLVKVLKGYLGTEDRVTIELSHTQVSFKCAGTRRTFPCVKL